METFRTFKIAVRLMGVRFAAYVSYIGSELICVPIKSAQRISVPYNVNRSTTTEIPFIIHFYRRSEGD